MPDGATTDGSIHAPHGRTPDDATRYGPRTGTNAASYAPAPRRDRDDAPSRNAHAPRHDAPSWDARSDDGHRPDHDAADAGNGPDGIRAGARQETRGAPEAVAETEEAGRAGDAHADPAGPDRV